MKEKLQKIREDAIAQIENSNGLEMLNDVRNTILGKKGELSLVLRGMKDVSPEDRPKVGQWVNETKEAIERVFDLDMSQRRLMLQCQLRSRSMEIFIL